MRKMFIQPSMMDTSSMFLGSWLCADWDQLRVYVTFQPKAAVKMNSDVFVVVVKQLESNI